MSSSRNASRMACYGCHGCEIARCFGCCACVSPENCPGCCSCSRSRPRTFKPGLSPAAAIDRGFSLDHEGVWLRMLASGPPDASPRTWNYGIGAPKLELFFQCPNADPQIQDICKKAAYRLSEHRAQQDCDCDWASIGNRHAGSGRIYRFESDGVTSPRLFPRRCRGDERSVCADPSNLAPWVRRYISLHDGLCNCGCFGVPDHIELQEKSVHLDDSIHLGDSASLNDSTHMSDSLALDGSIHFSSSSPMDSVQSKQNVQSERCANSVRNMALHQTARSEHGISPEHVVQRRQQAYQTNKDTNQSEKHTNQLKRHTQVAVNKNHSQNEKNTKGKQPKYLLDDDEEFDTRTWPSRFDSNNDHPLPPPTIPNNPYARLRHGDRNAGPARPLRLNSTVNRGHENQHIWDQPAARTAPQPLFTDVKDISLQALNVLIPSARDLAAIAARALRRRYAAAVRHARNGSGPPSRGRRLDTVPEEEIEEGWVDAEDEF